MEYSGRGRRRRLLNVAALVLCPLVMSGCYKSCQPLIEAHKISVPAAGATAGAPVTVDASWNMIGYDTEYDGGGFDLDGDGLFETPGAGGSYYDRRSDSATKTYTTAQTIEIAHLVNVEDDGKKSFDPWDQSVVKTTLVVQPTPSSGPAPAPGNQPPLASMVVTPNPIKTHTHATFDATASSDPDGSIASYEFDTDGNGTYEINNGTDPTYSAEVGVPDTYGVGLRVTDNLGATGTTTRQMVVTNVAGVGAIAPVLISRARQAPDTVSIEASGRRVDDGDIFLNGNELVSTGVSARGKLSAGSFPRELREGRHRVRWAAQFDTVAYLDSEATGAEGVIRFGYPAGGQSCLAFRLKASPTGEPSGRFRVIGGSGKAKSLRGSGAGTGRLVDGSLELSGALRLREGREWSRLGKDCAPLGLLTPG